MYILLSLIVIWNLAPLLMIACLPGVPWNHKFKAMLTCLNASWRGLIALPFSLLAPIVVPIALIFTKREADKLPRLFTFWDNDISINGDWPQYWPLDYHGSTYYSKYEPRSFLARFNWLVYRNRASKLGLMLGKTFTVDDSREHWGDLNTDRNHEGWTLRRCGTTYQFYAVKRIFSKLVIRINFGFKLGNIDIPHAAKSMVICIAFSILSWTGA